MGSDRNMRMHCTDAPVLDSCPAWAKLAGRGTSPLEPRPDKLMPIIADFFFASVLSVIQDYMTRFMAVSLEKKLFHRAYITENYELYTPTGQKNN